jgi:hypothetical protein
MLTTTHSPIEALWADQPHEIERLSRIRNAKERAA